MQRTTTELFKYHYEYTDLFCGEANYSWLRQGDVMARDVRHASRLARKKLELSGVKGDLTMNDSDFIHWKPRGSCTVLIVGYFEG